MNSTDEAGAEDRGAHVPVDDRAPEEKDASRARIRAWLARPDVSEFLERLKRRYPKCKKREE